MLNKIIFFTTVFSLLFCSPASSSEGASSVGILIAGHDSIANQKKPSFIRFHFSLQDSLLTRSRDSLSYVNSSFVNTGIFGRLGSIWSFQSSVRIFTDWTSATLDTNDYSPSKGIPYNLQTPHKRTWDILRGQNTLDFDFIKVNFGLDYLEFGPARRTHLAWTGMENRYLPNTWYAGKIEENAPVLFAGFTSELSRLKYIHYNGKLKSDKSKNKFFHTHRLEIKLPARSKFSLGETVVYGTRIEAFDARMPADSSVRSFEYLYAIPFLPYLFAEHYNGDRGNVNLNFDGSTQYLKNTEVYFELILDDMKSPTAFFDDSWWGNKWGAILGAEHRDSLSSFVITEGFEYSRIEPWVYTHTLGASHRYTNYSRSIGSPLGPNSEELAFMLQFKHQHWGSMSAEFTSTRKDSAKGSQLEDVHFLNDPIDKNFLNSNSTLHFYSTGLWYHSPILFKHIFWNAGFMWTTGDLKEIASFSGIGVQL